MELPFAYVAGLHQVTEAVNSARPNAPVVADVASVSLGRRLRFAIAHALRQVTHTGALAGRLVRSGGESGRFAYRRR